MDNISSQYFESFCQRIYFYIFSSNTSLNYREFNLGSHACSTCKEMDFKNWSYGFLKLWQHLEFWSSTLTSIFSLQALIKLTASLRYKIIILFQCLPDGTLVNQHKKPPSPMKGWFTSHLVSPSFCCWCYVSF